MSENKLRDAHMALKRKDHVLAKLKDKEKRLDALRERVIAVRELHKVFNHPTIQDFVCCYECSELAGWGAAPYPCDTIKALDGDFA